MKERKIIFLLFAIAAGFRILHYCLLQNELVVLPDQMQNIQLARRFAAGDFYGVLDVYWTPLYPILVGIVTYFVDSLMLPSVIVAVIACSLAAPVTYCLVKQSYGRREGIIAAALAVFYPHLINSFFTVGTENVYLLWIVGALVVGWKALQKGSVRDYLLTGILLGLAYLTRPEAFAYPIFFALFALGKNWRTQLTRGKSASQIAALILGFLLFAAPYLVYLRNATGTWTFSGKVAVNTVMGEPDEESPETGAANPDETNFHYQSGRQIIKEFAYNLFIIHKDFPVLVPLFLLMLAAVGLFGEAWNFKRLEREIYLIFFLLLTIFGYAAAVVQTRYFFVILPIFFGWMARGIVQLEKWFQSTFQRSYKTTPSINFALFVTLCLVFIYAYVFPLNFFMQTQDKAQEKIAYEERDAGLWLKENSKPSPFVFSASQRPVFYAEGKQLPPSTTDINKILAEIKNCRVDYVITSERSIKRNPFLKGLTEILQNSPEFELIYRKNARTRYEISIFKLK